jgi:PAS domain S-box-containing protein
MLETEGIFCHVIRVETQVDFCAALEQGGFDLILADYTLPSFDGLSALKITLKKYPAIPFIFVSGTLGEEVAIEALQIGATDYVLKERLSRLVPSVHRALREAQERAERKRAEVLLTGEKQLLEMIAKGHALSMILEALCRLVEELSKGSLASILLLDPDGKRLWHGAAPSLPASYTDAIDGGLIGPAAGSCGTAAYRKEPIMVADIAQDPLWADYRELALSHGLRACWSTPLLASDGRVLGTFALYASEPSSPTPQQHNIIEQISNLTSIAIERKRAEEERQTHLGFLETMDQVNRAIQGTNDLEQMMSDVLDALLTAFQCDRAWLVYPCDPDARWHGVKMQRTRPEFPGLFSVGLDLPVDAETADVFRTVRTASGPVRFGPGAPHPLPPKLAQRLGIQSRIVMALYPKGDQPYLFGLSQCSYPRVWTSQEERLFQEIGRRLEDALTSLLMLRTVRDSERKLEEAQRLAHVGYWDRDPETAHFTWSDETYRIFGLQPQAQSLNLAQLRALVHPEDRQRIVQAVAEALRGGRRYDVEYRVVRPTGEVRIVHSQGDVLRDESGRPRRMFGTVQDITERKQAEQHLVAQHTITQILAGAATLPEVTPHILQAVCECLGWDLGALWSLDRQAGVLRCVELWHKKSVAAPHFEATSRASTFLPGSGLPGRVWSSRAPAYIPDIVQDANFLRAPIAACEGLHTAFGFPILLGGDVLGVMEFFSHESRQLDPDLLPMMATIGSQIGQFIERKRAEEALRVSEASLAEGQQISHTGSWRWNLRTGDVRGSAEHSRIFGFDPAAGPRSHLRYRERVHPNDRPALVHVLESAIRDQRAFQHEYRIVLPDDLVKYVQFAGRPDTDASGDLELVGTIIDITERKRAEEALHNAQMEIARMARLTTLGELAASIAHEINQPLGAVVNNASACVRWLASQNLEEARQSALRVIADGHRAGDTITRIRALAKKAPPHKDWLDLNATIRDVLALARSEVQRNGVALETHLAEDVPLILGDRIQLQQVLLNLVMNAIEALSSVSAGPRALWVSSENVASTEVMIAVCDSGPGLEPQSLDRLFEAFYTTKPQGLGLGLAISRRIIEAHGGRLWATANVPQGAVVQFTVPIGNEGGYE